VVSVMQMILSDVETMVSVKKKVFSAMKKMLSVPSTNRFTETGGADRFPHSVSTRYPMCVAPRFRVCAVATPR
jgi:hypothetical protein